MLLDIGTGDGRFAEALAHSNPRKEVLAIEPDAEKFEACRRLLCDRANVKLLNVPLQALRTEGQIEKAYLLFPYIEMLSGVWVSEWAAAFSCLAIDGRMTVVTEYVPSLSPIFRHAAQTLTRHLEVVGFQVGCEECPIEDVVEEIPEIERSSVFEYLFRRPYACGRALSRAVEILRETNRLEVIRAQKPGNGPGFRKFDVNEGWRVGSRPTKGLAGLVHHAGTGNGTRVGGASAEA